MSTFTISVTVEEAEQTIRRDVAVAGLEVFKLVIDHNSILLSIDINPGEKETRKSTYAPYGDGRLLSAMNEVRNWVEKVKKGITNVAP